MCGNPLSKLPWALFESASKRPVGKSGQRPDRFMTFAFLTTPSPVTLNSGKRAKNQEIVLDPRDVIFQDCTFRSTDRARDFFKLSEEVRAFSGVKGMEKERTLLGLIWPAEFLLACSSKVPQYILSYTDEVDLQTNQDVVEWLRCVRMNEKDEEISFDRIVLVLNGKPFPPPFDHGSPATTNSDSEV